MNTEQLKHEVLKMTEERVQKGTDKFNSLVIAPVLYVELGKKFDKELVDTFRNVVYDTCILHPDWEETAILQEVSNQFKAHGK